MSENTCLENFMKENNLSKEQLAKKCGVSVCLIGRVLERKNVSSVIMFKIAVVTKIRLDDFIGI